VDADSGPKDVITYKKHENKHIANCRHVNLNWYTGRKTALDRTRSNFKGGLEGYGTMKTASLQECKDICSDLDICKGFTRQAVSDTEEGRCFFKITNITMQPELAEDPKTECGEAPEFWGGLSDFYDKIVEKPLETEEDPN